MGRRSDFERRPQDKYFTPYEAVVPLLPHLPPQCKFIEPCAGNGALIGHFVRNGHKCVDAFDIEPDHPKMRQADALTEPLRPCDYILANPPWTREILHQMIVRFSDHAPTWMLFDADWIHTRQAKPYMSRLRKVVSVGRVKWIEGSKMSGKDNVAWSLFSQPMDGVPTVFVGR